MRPSAHRRFDDQVLAFDLAQLMEAVPKCVDEARRGGRRPRVNEAEPHNSPHGLAARASREPSAPAVRPARTSKARRLLTESPRRLAAGSTRGW